MFSEFEEKAHAIAEKGEPFTKESLNSIYLKLNKKYYGKSVVSDSEISYEWARIPHFYRAFYVYKYATGIISAIAIAERILNGGEKEVKEYFDFLSSGCSNIPTELLKLTGVDLLDGDAMEMAFKSFEDALNEFEKLI
jgi:oligoendopeptidase F